MSDSIAYSLEVRIAIAECELRQAIAENRRLTGQALMSSIRVDRLRHVLFNLQNLALEKQGRGKQKHKTKKGDIPCSSKVKS